jgi:hypothetical protein
MGADKKIGGYRLAWFMAEVVAAPGLFETLVIQGEPLDDIFPQSLRGPDAKLGAAVRFHPVAHGYDDVEVEVVCPIAFPVGGSC